MPNPALLNEDYLLTAWRSAEDEIWLYADQPADNIRGGCSYRAEIIIVPSEINKQEPPTLRLSMGIAQRLCDELYHLGFRPKA